MLALIENLWWSVDEAQLSRLKREAQVNLRQCQGYEIYEKGCVHLISVTEEMVKRLKEETLAEHGEIR